jgi:hypothetical protein
MRFIDLKFDDTSDTHGEGAIQAWVEFENGLAASIVRHKYSYGHEQGLYEIGCFNECGMVTVDRWHDQVIGHLGPQQIEAELEYLKGIK